MEINKQSNMREIILNFSKQFSAGLKAAENMTVPGKFDGVIVCGMGGSAWPAEILQEWLKIPLPFYVNKTYNLPSQAAKNTLIIISSYSGNTEEPIACYNEAKKRGLKLICLTTDGRLKKLCQKENVPLVLMPQGLPAPRLGCGYTFAGLAKILSNAGLAKDKSKEIISMAKSLDAEKIEKEGQRLAGLIGDKIPIIYASADLKSLSYAWKIKFNETSKIPAFCNYFPEMNHNELSAYAKPNNNFFVILLMSGEEDKKIIKRMTLTADIIRSKNIPAEIINLQGKNLLEKIFNAMILADWTSYYLALKSKVDPLNIKLQEEFKEKLK